MSDFVSFLGRSLQLKTLLVGLRWNCRTSELEDILRDVALPVELPNIEVPQLLSKYFNPLSLIMDAIRIPHDGLDSIKVLCGETKDESSLRAICNFLHSDQRDHCFSPDQIDISWNDHGDMHGFTITCDQAGFGFDGDTGVPTMSKLDHPSVVLNTGNHLPFPPGDTSQFRVPIDFDHLHTITIGEVTEQLISCQFWKEIGDLKSVEVVQFDWAGMDIVEPFLCILARDYDKPEADSESDEEPTTKSRSTSPSIGEEDSEDPHPCDPLFPALRAILFGSIESALQTCFMDLESIGYEIPRGYGYKRQTMLFLDLLGCKLTDWKGNGGRWLDCLVFRKGNLWSGDPQPWTSTAHEAVEDFLEHVNLTARTVILGDHAYSFDEGADGQESDQLAIDSDVHLT
jgi:hypothetical protein